MKKDTYIPGVCNIGPQEINRRRRAGWTGLVLTLLLVIIVIVADVSLWWRLLIFFPATLSAIGFLQAHFHFCVGFAHRGVFNFGEVGEKHAVKDSASLIKDRKRGNQINLYAIIIGVIVTAICLYL